jgi:ATP-binding cassette subfamily B protein
MAFGPALAQLVSGLAVSSISIYNMLSYGDVKLVTGVLTPVFLSILVILYTGGWIRIRFQRVQESFAAVTDRMQESITGIRVIKAYVQEDGEIKRFETLNDELRDAISGWCRCQTC